MFALALSLEHAHFTAIWLRAALIPAPTESGLPTDQKWGVVETTPNHSIYGRGGATFYPEERAEVSLRPSPSIA